MPDTFDAYKRQRHRWAYGGFQLLRKHWRQLLPQADGLSREQKREYGIGWLNWMGSDSIGVVVALLNVIWVPFVAFLNIAVPDRILTLPIIAAFAVSVAHFISLYRLRVRASFSARWSGARWYAMSLSAAWTVVARAKSAPALSPNTLHSAHGQRRHGPQRFLISGLLEAVIAGLLVTNVYDLRSWRPTTSKCTRSISSPPFLWCRAYCSWRLPRLPGIEGTRFSTSFIFWRAVEARIAAKAAAILPQSRARRNQRYRAGETVGGIRIEAAQ